MKKKKQKDPAQLTVAELMKTHGVPLPVYLWLERLTGGEKYALEHTEADPATYHIARLVYDVLKTDSAPAFARVDDTINSPHVHCSSTLVETMRFQRKTFSCYTPSMG
jgi:hypothetical protein